MPGAGRVSKGPQRRFAAEEHNYNEQKTSGLILCKPL
jgi:hypothetical protein